MSDLRPFAVVTAAIKKFKVDIRHPHDIGGGANAFILIDIADLCLTDLAGNSGRRRWWLIRQHLRSSQRLSCPVVAGECGRPDMDRSISSKGIERAIDPVSGCRRLVVENILRLTPDVRERTRSVV